MEHDCGIVSIFGFFFFAAAFVFLKQAFCNLDICDRCWAFLLGSTLAPVLHSRAQILESNTGIILLICENLFFDVYIRVDL